MVGGAYVEGWGLYSERLADEMGLYRTEAERFGMLDAQAWRAGRLVVDTGLHALRWERQRSIDFLRNDAGLSETDAVIETDRYICWPGQALTYKLGQRVIEKLRRELTARDGSAFDLREFHDQVLGHGSLPLATLARELPDLGGDPTPGLGVEADPEGVQGLEDDPAPALVAVGAVQLVADEVDRRRAERLGRERERRRLDDAQPQQILVGPQDEVAHDAGRPAAGPHAQARCSRGRTSRARPSSARR